MLSIISVHSSQLLFWKDPGPWALALTLREFAPSWAVAKLTSSPSSAGEPLAEWVGSRQLISRVLPCPHVLALPRKQQLHPQWKFPQDPHGLWLWAKANQGHGILHQLLGVQGRPADTRASPEAPHSGPLPCRCQNRLLSVVLVPRQRFSWGRWEKGLAGEDSSFLVLAEFWLTCSSWRLFLSLFPSPW